MKKIAITIDFVPGSSPKSLEKVFSLDLSLQIPAGRWTCIVGPNGAGKSTLLRAMAGLPTALPVQGKVMLQGQALQSLSPPTRAQQLAWLAQDETGGLDMRVQDVVMLGRLPQQGLLGAASSQDHAACAQAMQQAKCAEFAHRLLGHLSAGQQQRVRLARALATQAKTLLLDEPLTNLDPPHQIDCVQMIRAQVAQGVTVVTVLHELPIALLADDLVLMQEGRVIHQGACQEAATHRALEAVFEGRLSVQQVMGQWVTVALPMSLLAQT
jgi:iron complex transport system ATP-binding protein